MQSHLPRKCAPPAGAARSGLVPAPASASQLPEQHSSFLYPYFRSSDFIFNISALVRGLESSCLFYNMYSFQAHVRSTENGFLQSPYAVNTIIVAEAYGRFYFESDSRLDEDFYVLQSRASFVLKLDHVTAENDGFLTKVKPRQSWLTGLKT